MTITTGLSYRFYLQLNKGRADGKFPIYLRIFFKRKKMEIATDYACTLEEFNDEKQRTHKNFSINEGLAKLEAKIHSSIRRLEDDDKFIDLSAIKDEIKGTSSTDTMFLEYYQKHIDYVTNNPQLARNTKNRYRDTQKHLIQFVKEKRKRRDIPIQGIDFKFINDFDLFLLNQKAAGKKDDSTLHRNTANKHITRFKTVILKAFNEGLIKSNPFTNIRMKYIPSTITYLSKEELDSIENHDLGGHESLLKVRDIFLFSCYTGLRFNDAIELGMDKIVVTKNSGTLIRTKQNKTGEYVEMPALKPVVDIIERNDTEERKITKRVLPQISNQKLNGYLKIIAGIVGIKKKLSHHVARHTCATTVLLNEGVPMEVVSQWLGHNSIRSTQVYGKVTNKYMQEIAERLNKNL